MVALSIRIDGDISDANTKVYGMVMPFRFLHNFSQVFKCSTQTLSQPLFSEVLTG